MKTKPELSSWWQGSFLPATVSGGHGRGRWRWGGSGSVDTCLEGFGGKRWRGLKKPWLCLHHSSKPFKMSISLRVAHKASLPLIPKVVGFLIFPQSLMGQMEILSFWNDLARKTEFWDQSVGFYFPFYSTWTKAIILNLGWKQKSL